MRVGARFCDEQPLKNAKRIVLFWAVLRVSINNERYTFSTTPC